MPDDPEALMLREVARIALKDYDNALSDLNGALSRRESVEAHFVRAKVYEQKKDLPRAIADLRRAAELPPRYLGRAAGSEAQPGRLWNWIGFSGVSPAARCQPTISSWDQVPDELVSAKYRSITAGTPPPSPGDAARRKSPIA